jgi:hypothetical protein
MPQKTFLSLTFAVALLFLAPSLAQAQAPGSLSYAPEDWITYEYARLITLESVMSGGTGRSRLFLITPDGKRQEDELKNYYSLTGINFSNVYLNEERKTYWLNKLAEDGWVLYWIETGSQEGIYTTKYLMRRPKD